MTLLDRLESAKRNNKKLFALLVDPDKNDDRSLKATAVNAVEAGVDLLLVGSSLLLDKGTDHCVSVLKSSCHLPVFLFPGNSFQLTEKADGILFLSLISGRNADLLIGQQVVAAPFLRKAGIEVLPTGYLLIDGGTPTSASYMSQSMPVPHDKSDIAAATAIAGELLGMKTIYLDTGSGALRTVNEKMVKKIRASVETPLIVGGGIRTREKVNSLFEAGADMVVVGNSVEQDPALLFELTGAERPVHG
jgi:putative glycerol-1-phosphate prenyltransferase